MEVLSTEGPIPDSLICVFFCVFLLTNLCCDQGEMRADDLQLPAESSLFVDLTRPWALTMLELGLAMQDLFQPLHVILHLKKTKQIKFL